MIYRRWSLRTGTRHEGSICEQDILWFKETERFFFLRRTAVRKQAMIDEIWGSVDITYLKSGVFKRTKDDDRR